MTAALPNPFADPDEQYRLAAERLRELEGTPFVPETVEQPRGSMLADAAPYLVRALQGMGPAVLPGRGHQLANIGSVLAQGYLGGRASAQERMFRDYDRRRREAMERNEQGRATRRGEIQDALTTARQAGSDLSKWRRESGIISPEMAPFAPGYKAGDRVPATIYNNALDAFNKSKEPKPSDKPPKEDLGPYMTVQTTAGPKLMRAGEAAKQGFIPTNTRETRVPSAAERDQLAADIGLLDQINRVRSSFNAGYVGPFRGPTGGARQRVGWTAEGEAGFRSGLAAIRNQILKLRSGGAVTDGEAARLLEELPTVNNDSKVFKEKLEEFENTFRTLAKTRREILSGTGVDLSRIPELPTPNVSPTSAINRAYAGLRGRIASREQLDAVLDRPTASGTTLRKQLEDQGVSVERLRSRFRPAAAGAGTR